MMCGKLSVWCPPSRSSYGAAAQRHERGILCVEDLDQPRKIGERLCQPVDLVDDEDVDPAGPDIGEQALQRRPLHIAAREPAIGICPADSVERAGAELACPR